MAGGFDRGSLYMYPLSFGNRLGPPPPQGAMTYLYGCMLFIIIIRRYYYALDAIGTHIASLENREG